MRKNTTALFLCMLCSLSANADIIVETDAGEKETSTVSSIKCITLTGGNLQIFKSSGTSTITPLAQISKIYFGTLTGIVSSREDAAKISVAGNEITASPINKGSIISVYSTDGSLIIREKASSDKVKIDISNQPNGIYIISIDGQSIKIKKQ